MRVLAALRLEHFVLNEHRVAVQEVHVNEVDTERLFELASIGRLDLQGLVPLAEGGLPTLLSMNSYPGTTRAPCSMTPSSCTFDLVPVFEPLARFIIAAGAAKGTRECCDAIHSDNDVATS